MGTFRYPIELGDRDGRRFERLEALADTGATYTMAPADLLRRLGVQPRERIDLEVADGRVIQWDVGEAMVRLDGKAATTIVVFGEPGDPLVLGAHVLEGVRMAVDLVRKRLVPSRAVLMSARSHGSVGCGRSEKRMRPPTGPCPEWRHLRHPPGADPGACCKKMPLSGCRFWIPPLRPKG